MKKTIAFLASLSASFSSFAGCGYTFTGATKQLANETVTINVTPALAGKYWFKNDYKGKSSTYKVLNSDGTGYKQEGSHRYELQWGMVIKDGKIACDSNNKSRIVWYMPKDQVTEASKARIKEGSPCISDYYWCRD